MRTVTRLVRDPDEAADAFQNALMSIWKNLKRIERHPNPHGYILRICVTAAYDVLRRRSRRSKREVPLAMAVSATTADNQESIAASEGRRRVLFDLIAQLSPKQAQTILLRVKEEQTFATIAQIMNCSEATSRSNFSKGVARLRELCRHLNMKE